MLIRLHVVLVRLEHEWRAGRRGFCRTVNGGQHLIFNLHELLRRFKRLLIARADEGHGVAEVVRDLPHADERRLILFQVADVDFAGNVLLRQDADDALERFRRACVDREHPRAGVGAAHRAAVAHPVDVHVVGVLPIAEHLLLHVEPVDARAQLPVVGRGCGNLSLAEDPPREEDAVDDLDIPRAAADIVADGEGRLLARGVRVRVEQCLGRDDHPWDAEAALHRARFAEGEGIDLLFPVGEPLNGENGLPLELVRLRDAGLGWLAVDEDIAGAAGALAAAVLHGGQVQRIAQKADQLLILLHGNGFSVDSERGHRLVSFSHKKRSGSRGIISHISKYYTISHHRAQVRLTRRVMLSKK